MLLPVLPILWTIGHRLYFVIVLMRLSECPTTTSVYLRMWDGVYSLLEVGTSKLQIQYLITRMFWNNFFLSYHLLPYKDSFLRPQFSTLLKSPPYSHTSSHSFICLGLTLPETVVTFPNPIRVRWPSVI